jgi:rRNA maturation endonuclease Nob1
MEQQPTYVFRCSVCGVETKHDHDGNGCHTCGRGVMRKQIRTAQRK